VLLDEITALLHDRGVAVDGVNLWIGEAQEEPDDGVVVRQYTVDQPAVRTMGETGTPPAADRERFQVLCRATARREAWRMAKAVRAALDWWDGVRLDVVYFNVVAVSSLGEIDPDKNLRYRVVGSYEAWKERS